jgi:glycerophosphoryl diester phosphodiesterase
MKNTPAIAFISNKPVDKKTVQMCTRFNVFSWHPDQRIVTRNQVKKMHATGIRVFPYNVDTFDDYAGMRAMKVDGVIRDDPVLAGVWSTIKKTA